jgi:hypothetical protein
MCTYPAHLILLDFITLMFDVKSINYEATQCVIFSVGSNILISISSLGSGFGENLQSAALN